MASDALAGAAMSCGRRLHACAWHGCCGGARECARESWSPGEASQGRMRPGGGVDASKCLTGSAAARTKPAPRRCNKLRLRSVSRC
eukprot:354318-Chlamydomonas_euryale.AAC.10